MLLHHINLFSFDYDLPNLCNEAAILFSLIIISHIRSNALYNVYCTRYTSITFIIQFKSRREHKTQTGLVV